VLAREWTIHTGESPDADRSDPRTISELERQRMPLSRRTVLNFGSRTACSPFAPVCGEVIFRPSLSVNGVPMSSSENRLQTWLQAIAIGIATSLVLGTILGVAVTFVFPEANDDPFRSNAIGVCICAIAAGVGAWQTHKYRPKRPVSKIATGTGARHPSPRC
jgi:hypothetical protein